MSSSLAPSPASTALPGMALPARPYPGFRPFRREEWPIFFGRERQVEALLALLDERHFICIHGPSGSGKSSLIEAGLMATLEREHRRLGAEWRTAAFRPGTSPLWNLACAIAEALGRSGDMAEVLNLHARLTRPGGSIARTAREAGLPPGANLLIVADQFEELFRFGLHGDAREARRFVDLMLGVFDQQPPGIHVAVAMRTDFLGDCASLVGLAEAVNAAPYLTPALTDEELRAAIAGPAELYGGGAEPALVERMLAESAAAETDRLPVLQHCLMRCWQKASAPGQPMPPVLTETTYRQEAIGGVQEALDRHADEVMASPELRGMQGEVELAFRALAELDTDGRAIRRPLPWARLLAETGAEPARMEAVVRRFAAEDCGFLGRPKPSDPLKPETIVDIAHEALIRRWRRMSGPSADPAAQTAGSTAARSGGPRARGGWLWDQARDATTYRTLLGRAREAREGASPVIEPELLDARLAWWRAQPRTPAWSQRMAGERDATEQDAAADLALVEALFARSAAARRRARYVRWSWVAALGLSFLVGAGWALDRWSQARQLAADKLAESDRQAEDLARLLAANRDLDDARRQAQAARDQADELAERLKEAEAAMAALQRARGVLPPRFPTTLPSPPPSVDLATEIAPATMTPQAAAPATASSGAGGVCEGAIWIGSGATTNLRAVGDGDAGRGVAVSDIQPNENFVSMANIRLRRGLPSRDGYVQEETIGIVPQGAQVVALGQPASYPRPAGVQYWLPVRVAGQVCSLVYFQFAGGTPADARALADALGSRGYLVPGQEQLRTAQGLSEVRYYYEEDAGRAEQLARDTTAAVQQLGLARGRNIHPVSYTGWTRQKPARGTLELWLDLTSR